MKTLHVRRKRRRAKAQLAHPGAVRKHTRKGGRTGHVHAKKQRAKAAAYMVRHGNPPVSIAPLGHS